jgi:hypothetical protein
VGEFAEVLGPRRVERHSHPQPGGVAAGNDGGALGASSRHLPTRAPP